MKHFLLLTFLAALAGAPAALAQKWEFGAGIGASFYTKQTFTSAVRNVDAGLRNGVAGSLWLGNNSGHLLGGELRYDIEKSDLELSGNGLSTKFGGQTHAFHYDFLLHFTERGSRVRPYVLAGGGVKLFRGTGTETVAQPLGSVALLTKTNEVKGLVSLGAGLKFSLTKAVQLRVELHDYMTPFPSKVIAPNQGSKVSGWLQDFVPSAGIAITF